MRRRDTSKYREDLLEDGDRKFSQESARTRCKQCLAWLKNWEWERHCVQHEADDFCSNFPRRLHTELRACIYCLFVTDSDSEMVSHIRNQHHRDSPSDFEVRGEQLNRVRPSLDLTSGQSVRLRRDGASDLARLNVNRRPQTMDATRDYGHMQLEYGRFGSHASHDSFSDESSPDSDS